MTQHLDTQPRRCLQCLRYGMLLTHGRCSTCRGRTPAAVRNEYHGGKARAQRAGIGGTLLGPDEAATALQRVTAAIDAAQIHRVEQIGPRCLLERHVDLDAGVSVQRVTLVINEREA